MPPFDHADAALASGSPFLAVAKPTLLLFALALGAVGGAIGDRDAFDAHRLGWRLVLGGVECRVRRHQTQQLPCFLAEGNKIALYKAPSNLYPLYQMAFRTCSWGIDADSRDFRRSPLADDPSAYRHPGTPPM